MKPTSLILIIAFTLTITPKTKARDFSFGGIAGFDITNSRVSDKPGIVQDYLRYHPMASFNVNGYLGYKTTKNLGLSLEPGFTRKGGIVKSDGNTKYQLNFIQVPVLLDFYLNDKLFISAGPEFGYLFSAKARSEDQTYSLEAIYGKQFELSGLIGLNYTIAKHTDLAIRYNHGLTSISTIRWTDAEGLDLGESKEFTQYFQIIVRFKI